MNAQPLNRVFKVCQICSKNEAHWSWRDWTNMCDDCRDLYWKEKESVRTVMLENLPLLIGTLKFKEIEKRLEERIRGV